MRLVDRFGEIPSQVEDLINSVRLKWIASELGLEKLIMKKGRLTGYFISDQQSDFYQSSNFTSVLQFVQANPKLCKLKEKQTRNGLRLLLIFDAINSVDNALAAMRPFARVQETVSQNS